MWMHIMVMVLLALPLCSYCLAVQSDTTMKETFQGTVVTVGRESVVIELMQKKREFVVPRDAMILLDLAEVPITDIKPGFFAMVTAEKKDDKWIVKILDTKRKV